MHKKTVRKMGQSRFNVASYDIFPAQSVSGSTFRKKESSSQLDAAGRVLVVAGGVHLSRLNKQKGISLCRRPLN
jgi:hypothetical protein